LPVLTSTTALELTERPPTLLIIGGGYIGCELAQMFARMGTAVTLVTRSRLLPEAEPEVSEALTAYLRDEGVTVRAGVFYRRIARCVEGVVLTVLSGGGEESLTAARVLVTTGRRPNTEDLNLTEAGVELDRRGAVIVDNRMRTTRPGLKARRNRGVYSPSSIRIGKNRRPSQAAMASRKVGRSGTRQT